MPIQRNTNQCNCLWCYLKPQKHGRSLFYRVFFFLLQFLQQQKLLLVSPFHYAPHFTLICCNSFKLSSLSHFKQTFASHLRSYFFCTSAFHLLFDLFFFVRSLVSRMVHDVYSTCVCCGGQLLNCMVHFSCKYIIKKKKKEEGEMWQ